MSQPLLSINIISYNTRDLTLQCLRSLHKSVHSRWLTNAIGDDIEIVLVDNASNDGTQEAVDAWASHIDIPIRVIRNSENEGFGKGHNRAARESVGEYLLLLNTDTVALDDALCSFVESFLGRNPPSLSQYRDLVPYQYPPYRVHFAGPRLLNKDLSPQPSCGPYYTIPVILGALFARGDHWSLTRYAPLKPRKVDWVSGACMLCKRTDFLEVGGFDEQIFMYMEEIDLLKRARGKGMQVWCIPQARFVHLGSASSNKRYPIYQVYRGFLYLYSKHHTILELRVVQMLLTIKAHLVMMLGRLLHRRHLIDTYTEALRIVKESY